MPMPVGRGARHASPERKATPPGTRQTPFQKEKGENLGLRRAERSSRMERCQA